MTILVTGGTGSSSGAIVDFLQKKEVDKFTADKV
jgi:uncharacterized protein YbjT (DUF2867 family)